MKVVITVNSGSDYQEELIKKLMLTMLATMQGTFHMQHKKNEMKIEYSPEWKQDDTA